MSTDPEELVRARRAAARRALDETDAASRRLRDVRRRALQLLGEPTSRSAGGTSADMAADVDSLDARMLEIERRMRETEAMIRRAEAGLGRLTRSPSATSDEGWTG